MPLDPLPREIAIQMAAPRNETENRLHPARFADESADGRMATGSQVEPVR